jgi:hypothetical protein
MLVICNGAIKSGSTWLYNILFNLADFERPPEHYLTDNSRKRQKNPCIQPLLLERFLAEEDIATRNFLSKNHIGRPEHRDLLMANPDVFVFDIERDVRDMVVSAYYDECNRNGYKGDFHQYYWDTGRYVADEVIRYHATWNNAGKRFCMVSYEMLHADFANEATRIAATLGLSLDAESVQALREKTTIGSLRKRYQDEALYEGDKFFRKGIVGDWRNHFDASMTKDIEHIETKGIGRLDRRTLATKLHRSIHRLFQRHG